jgi:aspartate/methionine/tyrosine aminotransferase
LAAPETPFSTLISQLRASGQPLWDLTVSNPTEALDNYPHSEIAAALASIDNFRYQPDPMGILSARQIIADRLEKRFPGLAPSPAHLALTASTSEAYAVLFKLLTNPGDEILVPTPSYPLFDFLARLESVKLSPYRLAYDGSWFVDFASLQAAVSPRTRALILVNPNNPTGSFIQRADLARLQEFAFTHSLPLISDEVFMDYAFDESVTSAKGRVPTLTGQHHVLTFTLNGLSKACGMPQMKLAWIAVIGPFAHRQQACARLEFVLDTYLSVGAPVQLALEPLFAIGDTMQKCIHIRLRQNLATLDSLLANQQIHRLNVEGGWSAILRVPQILTEEEWITGLLRHQQVIVQPGYFFDMSGGAFLVVSLLTPEQTFSEGIRRILAFSQQVQTV